jgi:Cu/Ag efflux pump CusA
MINSAICGVGLIVQIEQLKEEGRPVWDAVVEATGHRMRRPIMLTAAAASLVLIPVAREIFWGPMAYAMMGGIIVGTMLTLLFLPALYVAWFRIEEPASVSTGPDGASMSAEEPSRLAQPVAQPAH